MGSVSVVVVKPGEGLRMRFVERPSPSIVADLFTYGRNEAYTAGLFAVLVMGVLRQTVHNPNYLPHTAAVVHHLGGVQAHIKSHVPSLGMVMLLWLAGERFILFFVLQTVDVCVCTALLTD